ncbi:MAG: hypothetical protein GF417_00520 [Candidatus Latescibacteria bacterium]|nr:hypothetical protein [bacterium]MBD3422910.1 hypothetical protein [Candidatus Latescibacterota bacterium]
MMKVLCSLLAAFLIAGMISGCGGELEETYTRASLREANFEGIPSPGFKFSFESPEMIVAENDLAIAREDNLLEFFTGRGLAEEVKGLTGNYIVGATKKFNPMVHYQVDFIVQGQDTMFLEPAGTGILPKVTKEGFDKSVFEDITLEGLNYSTRTTSEIIDTKFKVPQATISYEEVRYDGEPEMAYLLNLENVSFIIEEPGDHAELMLKAYINEGFYFKGGVEFGSRPSASTRNYRRANDIGGKVTLHYVEFGGKTIPLQ